MKIRVLLSSDKKERKKVLPVENVVAHHIPGTNHGQCGNARNVDTVLL